MKQNGKEDKMDIQKIQWLQKIAENQQFRTTWLVEADGVKYIAKKIETDNSEKLQSLIKLLKRQVRFSAILNEDEQKKLSLFEDIAEGDGYVAFLRKYREGMTLEQCIATKRYSIADAVNIMLEISRTVQSAHEHNVFHGDLKPANIIVNDAGEVTIIDWDTMSISAGVQAELIGTEVTVVEPSGTPHYMPAEQFKGEKVSQQNDVYALGVILYQLLSGETPFDANCGQTPAQMGIYKQNHEPESITVKHPALGVPTDLGKVIEEALKNDKNKRIQSVAIFIQRLETIGKISASTANIPPVQDPKKYVPAKEKGKEHKLVLIGHTGSGKTVLAAGLYATQDKDFAVDDPGSKTETGIHAINTKTILEEGHWPAATSVGDITNLKFKLNYKGKEEAISFDEYAGERLEMENFDNAIVKDPDGAFILLNPGGKQWHDTRSKNSLLSDMKHYIDLLSKKLNHPPIALVITASDRLESDLKDFAPQFQKYVTELENYLARKNCTYKLFHVSVSGVLENQDRPQLNPQGIKDPFIWLLNRFYARTLKKNIKKGIKISAIIIAVLAFIWCCNLGREYYRVKSFKDAFLAIQKEYNEKGTKSDDDLIEYRNKLIELRNSICEQKHIANVGRQGECTAACLPKFFLKSFNGQFQEQITGLENEIDAIYSQYLTNCLNRAMANANDENRKVVDWIKKWQPLQPDGCQSKQNIQARSNREMPLAIERFDTNFLKTEFKKLIAEPSISFPSSLAEKYVQWKKVKTVLSASERQANESEMQQLEHNARVAVENRHFETLLAELEQIKDIIPANIQQKLTAWKNHATSLTEAERNDKDQKIQNAYLAAAQRVFEYNISTRKQKYSEFSGNINDIVAMVEDFFAFKKQSVTDVEINFVSQKHEELEIELLKCVERYIKEEYQKAHNIQMGQDKYTTPEYIDSIKKRVSPLFDKEREARINQFVDQIADQGKQLWLQAQKKKVDDFITKIQYLSTSAAFNELNGFYRDNRLNPYINSAEQKAYDIAWNELNEKLKAFDYTEAKFRQLKEFCAKIQSTPSPFIQKQKIYKFACRYFSWMNGEPRYTINIHGVEASSNHREGAYIYSSEYAVALCGSEGQSVSPWHNLIRSNEVPFYSGWKTIIGSFSVQCAPWQFMVLDFQPWENIEWDFDRKMTYRKLRIYPGKSLNSLIFEGNNVSKNGNYAEISFDNITLRIYFSISGETINDILKEAFQ